MLNKVIASRLRSGAQVVIVEEPDEFLAVSSAKSAAAAFEPVEFLTAASNDVMQKIEGHKKGRGTLIVSDFLRVYGGNPIAVRMIREVALQTRGDGEAYSRLILIETPGITVPESLRSDTEYLTAKVPGVDELKSELEGFINQHEVKVKGNGEKKHEIASAVAGLPRHEAARLFSRSVVEGKPLDPTFLRKEKAARVSDRLAGALTFVDTESAADVGGLGGLKAWLNKRRAAFSSKKAKDFGLPEPKGALILGVAGTGKSLSAKVTARNWGLPLLRLDAGRLFGSLVGQSESQTRQAIEAAEACAPCILWIDEIEKGLAGSSGNSDSGTSQRVFGTLLTWLQEKTKPVFVVATANRIAGLPPELLRKGRFDEIFFVDLPNGSERREIVEIHIKRHGRKSGKFQVAKIVAATEGFSGAEIEQAIVEGMFTAYSEDRDVTTEDIVDAANGTQPLSKTASAQIEQLKDWAKGRAKSAAIQSTTKNETGPVRRTALSK